MAEPVATPLTREQAEEFFAVIYRGKHHIPSDVRHDGNGVWSVSHFGWIGTYDYDEITRMVLLAHERAVRLWVMSGGPRRLRVYIQKRNRDSQDISTGHPTIELAIEKFRTADDAQWWKFRQERAGKEVDRG